MDEEGFLNERNDVSPSVEEGTVHGVLTEKLRGLDYLEYKVHFGDSKVRFEI